MKVFPTKVPLLLWSNSPEWHVKKKKMRPGSKESTTKSFQDKDHTKLAWVHLRIFFFFCSRQWSSCLKSISKLSHSNFVVSCTVQITLIKWSQITLHKRIQQGHSNNEIVWIVKAPYSASTSLKDMGSQTSMKLISPIVKLAKC